MFLCLKILIFLSENKTSEELVAHTVNKSNAFTHSLSLDTFLVNTVLLQLLLSLPFTAFSVTRNSFNCVSFLVSMLC